jgi:hypothetical protein
MALGEMAELALHQIFPEPQRNTAAAARQWASYQFRFMELRLVVAGYLPRTTQMQKVMQLQIPAVVVVATTV